MSNNLPKGTKVRIISNAGQQCRAAVVGTKHVIVCHFPQTNEYRIAARRVQGGFEGPGGLVPAAALEAV